MWKIYYTDTVVTGETQQDWLDAPDDNVQVIVEYKDPDYRSYRSCKGQEVYGKALWDGTDEFDPFGWGVKYGALLEDTEYFKIWNTACGLN